MSKNIKKEGRFYIGYLALAGVALLIALLIALSFIIRLPHDFDALVLVVYLALFLPAVVLALMGFFKFKDKKRNIAFGALGLAVVLFVLSVFSMTPMLVEKGLTDPNRYGEAIEAMKYYGGDMGRTFALVLPDEVPENAYDVKMSFNIQMEKRPMMLDLSYKLPQSEYEESVNKWLTQYSSKEIVEDDGVKSMVVYEREELSVSITRAVLFFWTDSTCTQRIIVFDGDTAYLQEAGINVR